MQTNSAPEREQLLDNLVEYERRLGLAWTREDVPPTTSCAAGRVGERGK